MGRIYGLSFAHKVGQKEQLVSNCRLICTFQKCIAVFKMCHKNHIKPISLLSFDLFHTLVHQNLWCRVRQSCHLNYTSLCKVVLWLTNFHPFIEVKGKSSSYSIVGQGGMKWKLGSLS